MKIVVRLKTALIFCGFFCTFIAKAQGQTDSDPGWYWVEDPQARGRGLPPGVPRYVDANGNVLFIDRGFTTEAYKDEAIRLMISEANGAAKALLLQERLPIDRSNIDAASVTPFDFFYGMQGLLGYISTTNYTYRFLNAGKLDHIEIDNSYEVWRKLQDELIPENQMDTNAAYQLAVHWLAALSVDVKALNRDCQLTIASSPVLNLVASGKEPVRRLFAPTYDVFWKSSTGGGAGVQLYLPGKLLIQLSVDAKYNLRPPLIFTNMAALFPGQAQIRIFNPGPTIVMDAPGPHFPNVNFITDSTNSEPTFYDMPLSRWIQSQTSLNPNHLLLSQLMSLKPVPGPDEWGSASFDLPIPFDTLDKLPIPATLDLGAIDSDGSFHEFTFINRERAPDGNTRLTWNINWDPPGKHDLRARLIYSHGMDGDDFKLIGPPLAWHSSNTCQFYETSTLFNSDAAGFYAKLREPAAKFRIVVTSQVGRLVNDISGGTTNGLINLEWNLIGLDGNKYTNNSFIGAFYITYPDDPTSNSPVKAHFSKIGTDGD